MKTIRLFLALLGLFVVAPLHGATFTVTNNNSSGAGSLRQALADAAFNGETDTIVFSGGLNGATVFISGSELFNNNNDGGNGVTIDASTLPAGITIRRTGAGFTFYNDGFLTLRGLTLTGGNNSGGIGGAVQNYGTMTLERCTLSGNSAALAGAIFNVAMMTLRQCTLTGNATSGQAAAIFNYQGATMTLVHCTVFGNTVSGPPSSGIRNDSLATLVLENSIVAANGGAGGDDVSNAQTVILNGANIVQTPIAGNVTGTGTVSNVDPQLAPLNNYGGPTQTLNPLAGSPAIDKAVGSVETIDQRGRPRPIDGDLIGAAVADIGSVEFSSSNADLASLALSVGALSPTFDAAKTDYTASVSNATAGITVTSTVAYAAATVTVKGNAVTSGTPSGNIALNPGTNPIPIVVTAQDGSMKTYTVTVTRLSNDATLSNLVLSAGTITFASGTTSYSTSVDFDTTSITVTPIAANANATINVNNTTVTSGSASGSIALNVGANLSAIEIDVTAQDGTPKTYTVDVTRHANANLSGLSVSAGPLSPAFDKAVTSYTMFVSSATDSTTVTPTVAAGNATVTVNGAPVASGAASGSIALQRGTTTIPVVVTATDSATKTYTVKVIRPYLVNNPLQTGAGTLRQALDDANASPGPDVIVFDQSIAGLSPGNNPFVVTSGSEVTIDASAVPGGLQIHGLDNSQIFSNQGTATLIGLKMVHSAGPSGAVANFNGGILTMRQCTVSDCSTSGSGGTIFNFSATLTMDRCTISGNTAGYGGAIFNVNGGTVTLRQCTIAGNHATLQGGAIRNAGTMTLIHCTVFGNTATQYAGIVQDFSSSLVLENSIVAGHGGVDIVNFSTVTANGANIVESEFGGAGGSGTISYVDPKLMALGNYGGPTQTMLPPSDSPAIDAAVGSTETIDQRGKTRPVDGDVNGTIVADIGAVEFASGNANLSNLVLSAGTLTPTFASATIEYTTRVSAPTASITVTPTAAHGGASIVVSYGNAIFHPVVSGQASPAFMLNSGSFNHLYIEVTAQDGTPKSYHIAVTRNTLPSAGFSFVSATTGDQKTITLPFNSTDPDGDPVTLTSTTPDSHLTVNSTVGKDVTFTPAANFVGDAELQFTVSDDQGGTSSPGYIFVTISDNDPPVIAAHPDVSVLTTNLGRVVVDYDAATATDNVTASPTITYSQDSGTNFPLGTTTVTVTVKDAANNQSTAQFNVSVHLVAPVNTPIISKDMAAPGAGTNGLPADALLTSFGTPATDDGANLAFLSKWTSATGGKGTGLFLNDACLGIVGGDAPIAGAKYKSFTDPVVDGGKAVCIAALTGTPKPPATVVLGNLASQTALEVIAQAGGAATADGAKFKTFKAVAVSNEYVGVFAQLAIGTGTAPKTTGANDLGLWIKDGSGPLTLALREGQEVAGGRIIKTLVSFVPGAGSPGQGRGWLSSRPAVGGKVLALVFFTDKTQGVLAVDAGDLANPILLSLAKQAGDGAPNLTGATFTSYGLPTLTDDGTSAFLGTMTGSGAGVTKANARGVFIKSALDTVYDIVVRTGDEAVGGAKFTAFKDPVLSSDDVIAFAATLKGGTVKGLGTTTLWWQRPGDALTPLAQGGATTVGDLPDAQWKAFTSLAIAGGGRGPIFAATLVPGKGGVTAKNATGVWATDFTDTLRLLFRTGDTIDVNGTMKTLKTFTLLKATVGSAGVTRSFNDAAQVVWTATFTDKTTAIITTELP